MWVCDSCHEKIEDVTDGWVEWLEKEEQGQRVGRGLRLVHHNATDRNNGCQYDGRAEFARGGWTVSDLALERFLNSDGLIELLIKLSNKIISTDDVIEMIKRLHIKNYEQARPHLQRAIQRGVIRPNLPNGFYFQDDLLEVIRAAKDNELD